MIRASKDRCWILPLLLLVLLLLGSIGEAATQHKAKALAERIKTAQSGEEIFRSVITVLDLLDIPVLNSSGQAIGNGQGDLVLYEMEIQIVVDAYQKGVLIPLEDLVNMWKVYGLLCWGRSDYTAENIEQALRDLRTIAEEHVDNPDGLTIKLIDELGARENEPFSLLGKTGNTTPEEDPILAMMYAAMEAALADIDDEELIEEMKLQFQGVIKSMEDGDLSEYLVSMSEQFAPELYATHEDELSSWLTAMTEHAEDKQRTDYGTDNPDADAKLSQAKKQIEHNWYNYYYHSGYEEASKKEQETRDLIEWTDETKEHGLVFGLGNQEQEETQTLFLDAIQVLLIQIDLFKGVVVK